MTTKKAKPDALPTGKMLAWAGAGASAGANFIVLGYMSLYATDTLGISPAIVGVMILVSSLTNVFGGLAAAWIVDRSPETRFGKARPYEFAVLGIWLATWLLFSTPAGFGETGRIIWLFVTYISINAVFDALLRANDTLYLARAFPNRRVFAKVATRAGVVTTLTSVLLSVGMPIAINSAGKDPAAWSLTIALFALPLAALGMTRFLFVKEEYPGADAGADPVHFRDLVNAVRTNRWLWALCGVMLAAQAVNGANMISYYFRYVVGNLALQSVVAGLGILILPVILLFPRLMRKLAISQILLFGAILGLLGSGAYLFANGNVAIVAVGVLLTGLGTLPVSYLVGNVMVLDLSSYNEWQGKRRLESTFGAVVGVSGRIGTGIAGLIVGQVLAASGYDGTQDTQSPAAESAIVGLFAGVPAVVFAIIIVLMMFYGRFDRKVLPEVYRELDARHAEASDAAIEDAVAARGLDTETIVTDGLGHAAVTTVPIVPSEQIPANPTGTFNAAKAKGRKKKD